MSNQRNGHVALLILGVQGHIHGHTSWSHWLVMFRPFTYCTEAQPTSQPHARCPIKAAATRARCHISNCWCAWSRILSEYHSEYRQQTVLEYHSEYRYQTVWHCHIYCVLFWRFSLWLRLNPFLGVIPHAGNIKSMNFFLVVRVYMHSVYMLY